MHMTSDAGVGRTLEQFGSSQLVLSPIQRTTGQLQVVCMHLGPGGIIGHHQAQSPQLFLVVQGEGWVRGAEQHQQPVPIHVGQAAFWESGEWHASGSEAGMSAIVIEGETLNPGQFMPEELGPAGDQVREQAQFSRPRSYVMPLQPAWPRRRV